MWYTANQDEFATVLREFSKAAKDNYGSHAFEAGYLQSLAVQMLASIPKREQRALIGDIQRSTQRQLADLDAKKELNATFESAY